MTPRPPVALPLTLSRRTALHPLEDTFQHRRVGIPQPAGPGRPAARTCAPSAASATAPSPDPLGQPVLPSRQTFFSSRPAPPPLFLGSYQPPPTRGGTPVPPSLPKPLTRLKAGWRAAGRAPRGLTAPNRLRPGPPRPPPGGGGARAQRGPPPPPPRHPGRRGGGRSGGKEPQPARWRRAAPRSPLRLLCGAEAGRRSPTGREGRKGEAGRCAAVRLPARRPGSRWSPRHGQRGAVAAGTPPRGTPGRVVPAWRRCHGGRAAASRRPRPRPPHSPRQRFPPSPHSGRRCATGERRRNQRLCACSVYLLVSERLVVCFPYGGVFPPRRDDGPALS